MYPHQQLEGKLLWKTIFVTCIGWCTDPHDLFVICGFPLPPFSIWPAYPAMKEPSGLALSTVAVYIKAIAPHILGNGLHNGWVTQDGVFSINGGPPCSLLRVPVALETPITKESRQLALID